MLRSADVLEKITGSRPVGMRTPSWDFSPHTLRIESEMGLPYDSSLMADEDCYELLLDGEPTGVVELPVEWVRDDAVYFMMNRFQSHRPYTPPADVFDIFRREFDAAYEKAASFSSRMHPHVIGYRSRIWIVEELIRHARSRAMCGSPRMRRSCSGRRRMRIEARASPTSSAQIAERKERTQRRTKREKAAECTVHVVVLLAPSPALLHFAREGATARGRIYSNWTSLRARFFRSATSALTLLGLI